MRAIRNMYFARSEPGSFDQLWNASRADATALCTSAALACATSASGASSRGEIVVKCSFAVSHSPPT